MNNTLANEITGKQMAFLTKLLTEATELLNSRETITGCEWPEAHAHVARVRRAMDDMTKSEASKAIGEAMDNNDKLREELKGLGVQAEPTLSEPQYVTETGMYQVDGRIFKVLPSRTSERHYAKELVGEGDGTYRFTYAPGAMRLIRAEHRMTDEQAREFGRTTGICCVCARLLTDPQSIAAGIGPVCSGKR
jgi:uncharacterized protein DUF6011